MTQAPPRLTTTMHEQKHSPSKTRPSLFSPPITDDAPDNYLNHYESNSRYNLLINDNSTESITNDEFSTTKQTKTALPPSNIIITLHMGFFQTHQIL